MARQAKTVTPVADIPLLPDFGWRWTLAVLLSIGLILLLGYTLVSLLIVGIGVWGVNIPFVWGFDLINYAWWIGIANGASLFAAIRCAGYPSRTSERPKPSWSEDRMTAETCRAVTGKDGRCR